MVVLWKYCSWSNDRREYLYSIQFAGCIYLYTCDLLRGRSYPSGSVQRYGVGNSARELPTLNGFVSETLSDTNTTLARMLT